MAGDRGHGGAIMLIATLTALGCALVDGDGRLPAIDRAEARWDAAALTSYRFEFRASCFCAPEYVEWATVDVRDDTVHAVVLRATGEPPEELPASAWLTVDELFDLMRATLERAPDRFEAQYDATLGYPTRVDVVEDFDVADGGAIYQLTALTPQS